MLEGMNGTMPSGNFGGPSTMSTSAFPGVSSNSLWHSRSMQGMQNSSSMNNSMPAAAAACGAAGGMNQMQQHQDSRMAEKIVSELQVRKSCH